MIRPKNSPQAKVSWEQAYKEMALEVAEISEWAEWDALAGDVLDD